MVLAAAVTVLLATLYALAVEPARNAQARLSGDLPRLQEQMARMEALRGEVRMLI